MQYNALRNTLIIRNRKLVFNGNGKLLLEREASEMALLAFELAKKDSSSCQDAGVF
jgi:hypothetical protein